MTSTHAVIIAAGDGTRWGDYGGCPKHFAVVDGEPILHRTVRLLREQAPEAAIWVVGPDDRYRIEGSDLYVPTHDPEAYDADKLLCSRDLWHQTGRTVVLLGDVYFTEHAMHQILAWPSMEWVLFGRAFPSVLTGKPYGEPFGLSFGPSEHAKHHAAIRRIVDLYRRGLLSRCGVLEHYRAMIGIPDSMMGVHLAGPWWVHIDDWTDDFDWPDEYQRFVARRKEAGL